MSIYKPAKSRFWHFDFQWRNYRHHGSTGCTAKRDGQRFEDEERRKAALGVRARPTITLDRACDAWWLAKGQHLRSHATVLYQLANLAEGLGRAVMIHDITLANVDGYIARRRASVKNASVNRETALLRRVFDWHVARGFDAPEIAWKEARLREAKPVTRVLAVDEETRLFAADRKSVV